jgi:hypothetical protein
VLLDIYGQEKLKGVIISLRMRHHQVFMTDGWFGSKILDNKEWCSVLREVMYIHTCRPSQLVIISQQILEEQARVFSDVNGDHFRECKSPSNDCSCDEQHALWQRHKAPHLHEGRGEYFPDTIGQRS